MTLTRKGPWTVSITCIVYYVNGVVSILYSELNAQLDISFIVIDFVDLEPSLLRCEVEKQLDFIKDEVEILEAVAKECQQQMADSSKKDYKQGPPTVCWSNNVVSLILENWNWNWNIFYFIWEYKK